MIGFNHSLQGMGANPMPYQFQYCNPYCNINSIPAGNNLSYNQRLYNNQQQFINQLVQPGLSYEGWKQQQGITVNSAEQEDYYLNLYNTSVLPQQRAQMVNNQRMNFYNQIGGQTMMPTPYTPYAYQQYIYGYDKTRDSYEYHKALCGAFPRMRDVLEISQSDILKKRDQDIKNQIFIIKKFTAIGMKHRGCNDKEINKKLNSLDEDLKPQIINCNYRPRVEKKKENPKQKKIQLKLVCGDKVLQVLGTTHIGPVEHKEYTREEIQRMQNEQMRWNTAREIQYQVTMNPAVSKAFEENINKFKDMSLVEFLNDHGGILVAEALESQFVNRYKNSLYNYNRSNYLDNIANHSQYKTYNPSYHPGAQSFYCSMKEDEAKTKAIKDIAVKIPTNAVKPMTSISFVDYLNFLDGANPVDNSEYQKNLDLTHNVHDAQVMTLYKSFHPEFNAEEYVKTGGTSNDPNSKMSLNEQSRLVKFYNAMIDRRPELRNGRID